MANPLASRTRLLRNDDLDAVAGGRPHDLPLGTNENVHYFGFVLPDLVPSIVSRWPRRGAMHAPSHGVGSGP
jgi:hypothetical protein